MWSFETLADFARVVHWLARQGRHGRGERALKHCLRAATEVLRGNIDRYQQCVESLDALMDGRLSHVRTRRGQRGSVTENLARLAGQLRPYFDRLTNSSDSELLARWEGVLGSSKRYLSLLKGLVGDFGNFDGMLPLLPPVGSGIINPRIQHLLTSMYRINTRNLRLMELIHDACKAWQADPGEPTTAFFDPQTDLCRMVRAMLGEYLAEADPLRVRAKQRAAWQAGRRFIPYRFWRPAEDLRQLADVAYVDGTKRRPVAKRRYVETHLSLVPPVCTDTPRMAWSLKEIFNNALGASSFLYMDAQGRPVAHPLARHAQPDPTAAVKLTLELVRTGGPLRPRKTIRLSLRDEGKGIPRKHLPYVMLWGYSPRRADAEEKPSAIDEQRREIFIGGKGIGLPYAAEVAREHGGRLSIAPAHGGGMYLTFDLPVPTLPKT